MGKQAFTDQMGRKVELPDPPRRIVSLVPSQTEFLFDLGLDSQIVGLTKFCIHPKDKCSNKPNVGGTKNIHIDRVRSLQPDLLIGNKEENEQSAISELEREFAVWMSDIVTINDAYDMMMSLGKITGKEDVASTMIERIKDVFLKIPRPKSPLPCAYLIWRKPFMAAGSGTFINNMLKAAGFQNVFEDKTRYPEITLEELGKRNPAMIMLSSEPYPFREKHFNEIKPFTGDAIINLVDGELFSWYGSRMLQAGDYFSKLHASL